MHGWPVPPAVTGADGAYRIPSVHGGQRQLDVGGLGCLLAGYTLALVAGDVTADIVLAVKRASPTDSGRRRHALHP